MVQAARGRSDVRYGKGQVTLSESWLDNQDRAANKLRETFSDPNFTPPTVPQVALDLMQLAKKPGVEMKELAALLEKDPFLAAHVLKLANSPLYAGGKQFKSLRDATVRLGLNTLNTVILEASLKVMVSRVKGFSELLSALWKHSRATAILSRAIARYTALEGEYAFSCGLLHDIGVAGGLVAVSFAAGGADLSGKRACLSAVMDIHEEAAALILRLWGLPEELLWVISNHHQLDQAEFLHPLAATVCVADHLANQLGFALSSELYERTKEASFTRSTETLEIGEKLELIVQDAEDALVALRDE